MALASLRGVGFWKLHAIAEAGLSFKELLKASSPSEFSKHLRVKIPQDIDGWAKYQRELWNLGLEKSRAMANENIGMFFRGQAEFPKKLTGFSDAPHWIFVQGNPKVLAGNSIAIVGTRKPSKDGEFLTRLVVASLAAEDLSIVSGLANGIDQIAHTESIRYEIPTIAILGTGIYKNYPHGSEGLRAKILESGGAVISEYLPDESYSAENFVRRNRLQAALGDVLVPVEWKIKSGTAHTVEYAWKYKKRIINVYLPKTYIKRPELRYSEEKRNALSIELPSSIEVISNCLSIKNKSLALAGENLALFDEEP